MKQISLSNTFSFIFLSIAIIVFPYEYLFFKIIPTLFWTNYFPYPFMLGMIMTFIILFPSMWQKSSLYVNIKNTLTAIFFSIILAVPISLFVNIESFSLFKLALSDILINILFQYVWVFIITVIVLLMHILFRLIYMWYLKIK